MGGVAKSSLVGVVLSKVLTADGVIGDFVVAVGNVSPDGCNGTEGVFAVDGFVKSVGAFGAAGPIGVAKSPVGEIDVIVDGDVRLEIAV